MSPRAIPTALAISSIGASCIPRSSNSARVARTRSRSRSRRVTVGEDAIAAFKAYGERSPSAGLVDLVLCYQQTRRMTEAKAGARQALAANPKFTIGNWRKTQFRNDVAQLEADVAALEAAGLPE